MMLSELDFRHLAIACLVCLITACGGGSSGGGDDDDANFPTPTVPAGARTINEANTDATVTSATSFVTTLGAFTDLKPAGAPTVEQVINQVTDQVLRRHRLDRAAVAPRIEDLSADFCTSGTAIGDIEDTDSGESGTVTFTNCDVGLGVLVNGPLSYVGSFNQTTLAYSLRIGGTLTFEFGPPLVTVVLNLSETGNDGTGVFSSNISFSITGIAGGGYLVTTTQNIAGDASGVTSGQIIVTGAGSTRVRITILNASQASVELDTGTGTFVSCAVLPGCTSPISI